MQNFSINPPIFAYKSERGAPPFIGEREVAWQVTFLPLGFAPGLIIAPGALSSFPLTLSLIYFFGYISTIPPLVYFYYFSSGIFLLFSDDAPGDASAYFLRILCTQG